MSAEPKITFIMEKVGRGRASEDFEMWACRGAGKGCKRNVTRARKVHCDDCLPTDKNETLQQVKDRIAKGDA